nr:SDR family NAD(P)-dependent oxidoreductase [Anaerocolumna cellulosilytica]
MLKTIEQEKKLDYGKRSKEDIAVIGMAVKLPKADSTEEFWYNIKNGIDCISDFPASRRGDTDKAVKAMYSREGNVLYNIGGYLNEIDKFDCSFFKLSPKEASLMDPSQRLLLQTTVNAIENAGYGGTKITGTKTGVYVGYSSDFGESYKGYAEWSENTFTGFTLTGNIESILAGRISYTLDLKGPSIVVDTACSSSLVAVHLACQGLRTGDCDMAVAGGVNINLLPLKTNSSQRIGIESSTSRARTFDDSSDGTGFGEGVAVVFLKPLNKAIDDGDIIHAVIKGTAVNQDGSSSGITAPNSAAQEEVILKAWKDANINPETITYIEAHGTGTRLGDPIEVEGIRRAFGQHIKKKQFCGIGSVKTNIGHLDNAAGIAGLIKVIMALKNKQLPPTLNFSRPNSHIDFENSPVYICNRLRRWETAGIPRRCGVNSFGLSGTNCHVVVEESPSLHEKGSGEGNKDMPYVLAISALSEEALKTLVTRYRHYIKNYITVDGNFLKNMCFTASTGRDHHTFRLALIIRDCKELADKLDKMIASDIRSYEREGIYYGRHRITADPGSAQTSGEISMDGIRQMSEQANRKIKEFVDSGQCKDDELSRLCELYIQGAAVQWEILFKGIDCKRTELPEYPFERKRCWLKGPDEFESANTTGEVDMFHTILWKKVSEERFSVHSNQGGVLVLCNGSDMGREITAGIREAGREVILAEFGDTFSKISDDRYIVGKSMHDYTRLIAEVSGRQLSKVLYITISMDTMEPETIRELHEIQQRGVFSFLNLIRALLQSENKQKVDFLLVSQNVNQVTGSEENLSPWQAPLFGLGRVIPKEYRKFAIRCLDIDSKTTVEDIIAELDRTAKDYIIAYRDGNKYVETLENVVLSREATDKVVIKRNGVYIITGGTGGIGLEIGQYLAEKENVKLALISRSQFPVKNEWKMEEEKGGKRAKQIKKIREIEETGSVVELCEADVSNWDDMKKCVNFLREKYGRINGIIHCAGVAGDGFIFKKDETVFKDVLNPKVFGTWILDKLTEDDEPDFFVMFSSMESLIGRAGQGDYTSANSFLDAYAAYRNNQGKRTFVINWPAWKDTGMAYDYGVISGIEFLKPMDISEAINAFDRVLHSGIQRVIPGELNIRVLRESSTGTNINIPDIVNDYIVRKNSGERVPSERCSIDRRSNYTAVKINGRESGSYTETEKRLADVWGGMLDIEEINVNDRFNEIGGNSIIAVGMEVELEKMGILADASDIDKYPTLAEFAAFLDSKSCGEGISKNKAETSPEAFSLVHTLDCNSEKPSLEATVSNEVILEGIEPFNDVYYKSCFYNSLFPVVKYFRKDVLAFLTNQIIAYDYSDNSKIPLSVSYHSIKDNSIILNEIGIIAHAKNTSQDIIYDITSSITEGKPVILWVDSYYEPIRNDTFHKKHLAHSWLIYGFNETKRECYIIEHRHSDSLAYEKCVLGYDDVINSYEGFINNFQNDMTRIPSYSNYSLYSDEEINGNKNSQLNHLHVFGENYLKYKDIVLKGLENIKLFQEIYTTIVEDEKVLSENVVPLINCLNEVINIKKVESYRARMIFRPKTDYAQIVDEITEYWDLIRKKLARYMYSSVYKPEELILTGKVINTIYIMEHRHHKMLSGDFIIKRNDSYIF